MTKSIFSLKFIMMAAVFAITSTVFASSADTYKVDADQSTLRWNGKKVLGEHWGYVDIKSGKLNHDNGKFSGDFTIDMTTIVVKDLEDPESNAKLKGHLESDDFFSVAKHSTAKLKVTKIEKQKGEKGETHKVYGKLTIKGITNDVTFPATLIFSGDKLTAKADFTIDRSKWDIRYGSGSFFDNLGDKTIYDDIWFTLNLVAAK